MKDSGRGEATLRDLQAERKRKRKYSIVIPDDILIEILSRLPASSVARFRHASKRWHSLTLDPILVNLHLERARATPRLLALSQHSDGSAHLSSLDPTGRIGSLPLTTVDTGCAPCRMSASCNGIVCIYTDDTARLLNPATGELLLLPAPTAAAAFSSTCLLAFVPSTSQYKLLRFYRSPATSCEVLTVGRGGGGWRPAGVVDYDLPDDGATVNGVIYFTFTPPSWIEPRQVVSFDPVEEVFGTVAIPQPTGLKDFGVFEFQGALCLWQFWVRCYTRILVTWKLQQDGVWARRLCLKWVRPVRPLMFQGQNVLVLQQRRWLRYQISLGSDAREDELPGHEVILEHEDHEARLHGVILDDQKLVEVRLLMESIVSLANL